MVRLFACAQVVLCCGLLWAQSSTLKLPFPAGENWTVTRGYLRDTPQTRDRDGNLVQVTTHRGKDAFALDFATGDCGDSWGKPVLAVADGVVERARQDTTKDGKTTFVSPIDGRTYGVAYGKNVRIDHAGGRRSLVGHLSEYYVKVGDLVVQGQVIGRAGDTGYVLSDCVDDHKGAHIHFAYYEVASAGSMTEANPDGMSNYNTFTPGLQVESDNISVPSTDVNQSVPLYPVAPVFVGHEAGLGFTISPAYAADGGTYQDFKTGRLFSVGTTVTVRSYPNGVGPGWFATGWDDRVSLAFARAYGKLIEKHGGNRLGFPANNGHGASTRRVDVNALQDPIVIQEFSQPTPPNFGFGGKSCLVAHDERGALNEVLLVQGDFYEFYRADPAYYGYPTTEQGTWVDTFGEIDSTRVGYAYLRQNFVHDWAMVQHPGDRVLFVHTVNFRSTWPPIATGGAEPFTLSGWPVSNRQVALTCRGNLELDANGHFSWLRDGVEVAQTALPEFTELNLTPGSTYTYRVEAVDDVWGVVDVSNTLTLTLPPADEFSLHAELKQANAVSLSVINHRFAVVWYYLLVRDDSEIARLSGEAFGDYDLEFNRTYTYQVVAMTASHMELGRTTPVTITTQPPPIVPIPPRDPARPASIALTLDRVEARVHESARASAIVSDQYGRAMIGPRVVYASSHPPTAYPDGDSGIVSANQPGTVEFHAELYDDSNLRSPLVTFTVHPADWTPPVPPVWRAIAASLPLGQDAAGRHWSSPDHVAWRLRTDVSSPSQWVTLPAVLWEPHLYLQPQHFSTDPEVQLPVDGITWRPDDGRLGVFIQTIHGCELWVNGSKVGEWGRPNEYGGNPINLPELGTVNYPSLTLPPVDITPYLTAGINYLVLHVTSHATAPELRYVEFVKLSGEVIQPVVLPNLVGELTLEPAAVTTDDHAVFGVTVENRSPAACPASQLSLSLDGQLSRTYTVPELPANGSHSFNITLDRLPEGSHTVTVVANSDLQIAESDDHNTAELQFTVSPVRQSDLIISGLSVPSLAFVDEPLPVTTTVFNPGNAPSPPFLLNLGFGGSTAASVTGAVAGPLQFIVPALDPGCEVSFSTTLTLAVADTFTLWADVDANGEVSESDKSNNQASVSFTVVALPPPNLVIPAVTMTPVTPGTTDAVTFTATVKNDGPGPSASCTLTGSVALLQLGFGDNLPSAEIPALPPGASANLVVTGGPFPIPIPHVAVFTADGTNLITNETKEDDNTKSIWFTVAETRPDLAIRGVTVTQRDSWRVGSDVVVENVGPVAAPFFNGVLLQAFLSRDTIFGNADDRAAGERFLPQSWGLNPGQRLTFSVSAIFPTPVNYAAYQYLVVKVDARDRVVESSDANNTFAARVGLTGTTVFADAMETGLNRWRLNFGAVGNLPVARTTLRPIGGTPDLPNGPVLYLGDRTIGGLATATAEFTVNLAGYAQALVEFDWNTVGLEPGEYVALDVFDGVWTRNVVRHGTGWWRHVAVDLSRFRLRNTMIIRFRSSLNDPEPLDAVYVDNVKVTAR